MIERFNLGHDHTTSDGTVIPTGTTVFAVKKGDKFFIWAYVDRDFALHMSDKLGDGPTNEFDRRANWRDGIGQLSLSTKTLADVL